MLQTQKSRVLEPLALAVARGRSIRVAVESLGCSIDYAYRVAAEPEFKQLVTDLRTAAADRPVGMLSDRAGEAVEVLAKLMARGNEP